MIDIQFPDGRIASYEIGVTPLQIAKKISKTLAKEILTTSFNGKMIDLNEPLKENGLIKFYKFSDKEGKEVFWHTSAHIMAQAVKRLFPNVKVAIGPAIKEGFYYDFESEPFSEQDLLAIEKEMKKIAKSGLVPEKKIISRKEALQKFSDEEEPYKYDLVDNFPEDAIISVYSQGEFNDLCRGPHLPNTAKVKHIKLLTTSGAYWRGNSDNAMLQRIYGISFPQKEDLDLFIKRREEADKREHRKLGQSMDLFSFNPDAPGIPFYHDRGMKILAGLIDYWRYEHQRDSYLEISTPSLMSQHLWETSGHWFNYRENMFTTEIEKQSYAIKPMNCPGGILWYNRSQYSYRDLPLRVCELGKVYRNEFSGALSGLFRVRSFTQDDGHIFMTADQIKDEIIGVLNLLDRIYSTFGLDYSLELSTRPEEKSIGSDEIWELATNSLKEALEEYGKGYIINEGDGAFYGPKIDIIVRNALGKEWQCGTVQLDFNLPERFDVTYIDENSEKKRAIMIHRALYGSLERFLGIILEHFGGFFPLWLSPVQVKIIPVSDRFNGTAEDLYSKLQSLGMRVELDKRSEKVGYKIRQADGEQKVPYMLVVGEKEQTSGIYTVRQHKNGNIGEMNFESLVSMLQTEIKEKKLPKGYQVEL